MTSLCPQSVDKVTVTGNSLLSLIETKSLKCWFFLIRNLRGYIGGKQPLVGI